MEPYFLARKRRFKHPPYNDQHIISPYFAAPSQAEAYEN